ncbi:S-adenosyl-L-methionine-dependent methyltransferase [Massarina eburnea CBS 473.64]|uniref:S-adenosyl-L-methionine-dependent methyltransferase n=1 Tax=Massarina eburnea CBS 473.64 TaxID=1395130 RepID=A0A6A6S2W8_9PLEO|nr:S-adenosyl-L-methionine-dependent methyltransferase [Massarina eburnea CBS 473.64]
MPAPSYLFSRDLRSSIRLNYQHLAIKQLYPYSLHPSIPTDATNLHVADIGAGTAIWSIEVARQRPSAQITGFDISGDQFPRPEWLPPNLRLETHDAFATFPERHHGRYDVVNVRFFVTLLASDEMVRTVVRNLTQLLRPGGYLQWQDANPETARAIASDNSKPKSATEKLAMLMPRTLWNQCYLLGYQEVQAYVAEADSSQDVKKEEMKKANKMIQDLEDEFRGGASMEVEYFCIISQKGT